MTKPSVSIAILSIVLASCGGDNNNMSMAENNVPMTDNNVPMTDNNVPMTDNNVPMTDNNAPMTDNNAPVADNNMPVAVDGTYSVTATSTTLIDTNGGTCSNATGSFAITDRELSGDVLTTNGNMLDVTGNVADNGNVVGGFAQAEQISATFTGVILNGQGSGDWEDIVGCRGTWNAVMQNG